MKKIIFTSAFFVLGLISCQQEQVMEEPFVLEETKVEANPAVQRTFIASIEDASTRTELKENNRVKWNAGDVISVRPDATPAGYFYPLADFTTSTGGFVAEFTGSSATAHQYYYAFYPKGAMSSDIPYEIDDKYYQGMIIPTTQTATADGFADELNIVHAKTTNMNSNLSFRNVCAMIKFKLSGPGASNVKKVRISSNKDQQSGNTPLLSGEAIVSLDDGSIYNFNYGTLKPCNYVDLEGSFAASTDYCIMVAPNDMPDGFVISFFNAEGKEFAKKGVKSASLSPSTMLNLGTINIDADGFVNGFYEKYKTASTAKPVTFVVIPEGFTKSELEDYHGKAEAMINFIFDVDPYKEYVNYFNVYILDAVSDESGADNRTTNVYKKTFFDAGWSDGYSDMNAASDRVYSFVETHCPDIKNGISTIDNTAIFMIINDDRYGGICIHTSTGRGYAMIPTMSGERYWAGNNSGIITNTGTWWNTALHEGGGHCFGRLADEYWNNYIYTSNTIAEHSWQVPMSLNVTADKVNNLLWSHMIPTTQGVKQANKFLYVSTYEGGFASYIQGIWRSEEVSCMDDNRAYFSAWQRWLIAKRIHDIAGEAFTYENFIAKDKQYIGIQAGTANIGTEGRLKTHYSGLSPIYNASSTPGQVGSPKEIMPPLPPPVIETEGPKYETIEQK